MTGKGSSFFLRNTTYAQGKQNFQPRRMNLADIID